MRFQFAAGHNNSADLADLAYEPVITKHLDFSAEFTANGVAKKIGGGTLQIRWDYLERAELITLMNQLAVNHREPSTEGTFLLPDWYRIPSIMNGQITLQVPGEGDGFYRNVIADITGLSYI
jgi:hypothetical protein